MGARAGRRRARRRDRHRLGLLDGRRRRAARGARRRSRGAPTRGSSSTRRTAPAASGRAAAARSPRPGSRARSTSSSARSARRSAPTARSRRARPRCASCLVNTRGRSSSRPRCRRRRSRARWPRSSCSRSSRAASRSCRPTPARCATSSPREGFDVAGSTTQIVPLIVGDATLAMRDLRGGDRARRLRPGDPAADRPRRHVAAAPRGDGVAHEGRAARGGADARPRRAAGRASGPATGAPIAATRGPRPRAVRRRGAGGARGLTAACAASSSPGPTPGSASPSWRRRSAPRCARAGERVAAFKPVLTGLDEPDASGWPPDHELLAPPPASRPDERRAADVRPGGLAAPRGRARRHAASSRRARRRRPRGGRAARTSLVVEGVGGLLVPLDPGYAVRDLARDLGLPLVVAARPGLGTINHTLLTLEAARAAGLDVRGVVLTPWPAEPDAMERSNRETIAALAGVPVSVLPHVEAPTAEALAAAGARPAGRRLALKARSGQPTGDRSSSRRGATASALILAATRRACVRKRVREVDIPGRVTT